MKNGWVMPTQDQIIDQIQNVIKQRYENEVLRSQTDLIHGALSVLDLISEINEEDEQGEIARFVRSTVVSTFGFGSSRSNIDVDGIPNEILSQKVIDGIKDLKDDPGHTGARAKITGYLAEGFKKFPEIDEKDKIEVSADEINFLNERSKQLSQRYKEIHRQFKREIVEYDELDSEYEDLLMRCEKVLSALQNNREIRGNLSFLKDAIQRNKKINQKRFS
jgi:hypothetical protein